jgi:hypothetical protein
MLASRSLTYKRGRGRKRREAVRLDFEEGVVWLRDGHDVVLPWRGCVCDFLAHETPNECFYSIIVEYKF